MWFKVNLHLKQQNNFLINKIWTTENFQQEASSGSLSFHPVLGNKKSDYQVKGQSNSAFWFAIVHMALWAKGTRNTIFILLSLCGLLCLSVSGWPEKSEKYDSFATAIYFNFVNKAEFGAGFNG